MSMVSYDVFDTVVTRVFAHPRDVFVYVGERLGREGRSRLDPQAFANMRWRAELEARRRSPDVEVLLNDIYREFARLAGWSAAEVDAARDMELAVEARHLRGIPLVRPALDAARIKAGRIDFLTDMYLPEPVLRPWLQQVGVCRAGDRLWISGEVHANKSSGQMFEIVRAASGGDFHGWRHTGDHPFADVDKPRQLGITATHFTQARLTRRERAARGTDGEFAVPWRSLLAGAMRQARLEQTPAEEREAVIWQVGAQIAGPLFYGFVRWALDEARRRGLRRLYFLARGGQIFHRLAGEIARHDPPGIECRYLYASRLAFTGPVEITSSAALHELVAPGSHFHSVRQALANLGLDEPWARACAPKDFRDEDWTRNLAPDEREALATWLLDPVHAPALAEAVSRRAAQSRAYLDAAGVGPGEPIGLVDTGWLGSIQKNLERILGSPAAPVPLTGFYLGLLPPCDPPAAGEMLGYTNLFHPLPLMRDESHKVLVELMAQADHGPLIGFAAEDGRWVPRLQEPGPAKLAEVRLLQEAVLAFARHFLDTDEKGAAPAAEYARVVIGLYADFHRRPEPRAVQIFGRMPHADQIFEQHHAPLCADLTIAQLLRAFCDYHQRPPHWWLEGQAVLGHPLLTSAYAALRRMKWKAANLLGSGQI